MRRDSVGVAKQYSGSLGKVREGTKGPIEYEFSKREVILSKDGLPRKTAWLIMKRTVGRNPAHSLYISNAPRNTRQKTFVWLSGIRWAIEQCFGETKTELGMDQYEVRKFAGWNHHMLTCMPAHFFLWHLKIRLGGKLQPSRSRSLGFSWRWFCP